MYHQHTGSAGTGGGCYGTAQYHAHTGDEVNGGGCYNQPVYHSHIGDSASGGECYAPIYHQHTDSCYQQAECTVTYLDNCQVERTETAYCHHHGTVSQIYFTADYQHESCGAGRTREGHSVCVTCNYRNKSHTYQKLVCGKNETTIEGYQLACQKTGQTVDAWKLGCGKDESVIEAYGLNCGKNNQTIEKCQRNCGKTERTVDSYKRNCNKTEKTIEAYKKSCQKKETDVDAYKQSCGKTDATVEGYALSCEKTDATVDAYQRNCDKDESFIDAYMLSCGKTEETLEGYELNCGREEETVYGEFAVWNETPEWTKDTVTLKTEYMEKKSFLDLEEPAFLWKEGVGESGTGNALEVKENGSYGVYLLAKNKEFVAQELFLNIEVKNIDRMPPVIQEMTCTLADDRKSSELSITAIDIQADGSQGSGLAAEAYSFDGGETWQEENIWLVSENTDVEIAVRDACGNIVSENVEIRDIEEMEKEIPDGDGEGEDGSEEESHGDGDGEDGSEEESDGDGDGIDGSEEESDSDGKEKTETERNQIAMETVRTKRRRIGRRWRRYGRKWRGIE